MNIVVLANRDIASNLALNLLLPSLAANHRVWAFLSDAVGGGGERPAALHDLKFCEQTLFNELVFPRVDELGKRADLCTFKALGAHTMEPIDSLNRVNSPESLARLGALDADLVLSIRYGGILREAAIALPRLGVINLHSGLLPAYRGVMASFRALLAGEPTLGTTLHYITDPGIDTGGIIAQTEMPVAPERSYLWHVMALYPTACEKLLACVAALAAGESLPVTPQPEDGQYFSFPDEQELDAFHERGLRLVDAADIVSITQRYTG